MLAKPIEIKGAKITVTNFKYDESTGKGGLWYDTAPMTNDYSIWDLGVSCTSPEGTVTAFTIASTYQTAQGLAQAKAVTVTAFAIAATYQTAQEQGQGQGQMLTATGFITSTTPLTARTVALVLLCGTEQIKT